MKRILYDFVESATPLFPFRLLTAGKNLPVLLPFYHVVSDRELPFRSNYNYPSVSKFEADLDFLLSKFRPIELDDLLSGKNLSKRFHLSFDDGLAECHDIIAPILKKKGIPATFFINPSFVDNRDLFHRYKAAEITNQLKAKNIQIKLQKTYADINSLDELAADLEMNWAEMLKEKKPYMSKSQVQHLQDEGFTIGAHSMDHPEFWLLDEESQLEEIRESMSWVSQMFSPKIKAFAFPFTDVGVSDLVFKTCHEENLFDISFGTAGLKKDLIDRNFQRLPMENNRGLNARDLLKEEYLGYRLKKMVNRHIARRD